MTEPAASPKVSAFVESESDRLAECIEKLLKADLLAIIGPLYGGCEEDVRAVIENRKSDCRLASQVAIVLDTTGGIIEVVERMVNAIRHHYADVIVVVPNKAMSAGTVLAMSGDSIKMDYFSCLGPIDPQIERNGNLVPALSYLAQFERLKRRSEEGTITSAELVLLQGLDLAELHSFEQARDLSIDLLKAWLAKYKFKDWTRTETRGIEVTAEMREARAVQVAEKLMDQDTWHSHGRPISMDTLRRDLNLRIDDFGANPELARAIRAYYHFTMDYLGKLGAHGAVHSRRVFLHW